MYACTPAELVYYCIIHLFLCTLTTFYSASTSASTSANFASLNFHRFPRDILEREHFSTLVVVIIWSRSQCQPPSPVNDTVILSSPCQWLTTRERWKTRRWPEMRCRRSKVVETSFHSWLKWIFLEVFKTKRRWAIRLGVDWLTQIICSLIIAVVFDALPVVNCKEKLSSATAD